MSDEGPTPGNGYYYMAGPYTDSPDKRFHQHLESLFLLTKNNMTIYSPIVHYHQLAADYKLPKDAVFWQENNFNMIRRALGMIVVCMPGWQESKGVYQEILFCKINDIPIYYMDMSRPNPKFSLNAH